MAPRPPRRRRTPSRRPQPSQLPHLVAAIAAAAGAAGWGAHGQNIDELAPEQLAVVLAHELQAEEKRVPERIFPFNTFQDMEELDCQSRMLLLLNHTITVRDKVGELHENIAGLSGLSIHLLRKLPQENSWIWLLSMARERAMQQIHAYWAQVTAVSLDKNECLGAEVRRVLVDAILQWKVFHVESMSLVWSGMAFGSYGKAGAAASRASGLPATVWGEALAAGEMWLAKLRQWVGEHAGRIYRALQRDLQHAGLESQDGATRMHHQDEEGMFVPYEYLRRKSFGQWALDKGLLRGLLRHVWQPPLPDAGSEDPSALLTVGDFGAGGGQYSSWLNETGLVQAFAFDGTKNAAEVTGGAVQEINLIEDTHLWRTFDWAMCLEVGEHIPKQFSKTLIQNLRRHVKQGLVMSWSDDWEGIGHVNCLSRDDFVALVERETGLRHDPVATDLVKRSCEIDYIARTIAVFRATDAAAS